MFKFIKRLILLSLFIAVLFVGAREIGLKKFLFPKNYSSLVKKYAAEYGLEENLIYSVIKVESNFNSDAISNKNARGLMQISEATGEWGAKELEISDYSKELLFEPEINIRIGCWYLNKLISQYDGNIATALAAYNAGSGNVGNWLTDTSYSHDGISLHSIPFYETDIYTAKVLRYKKVYDSLYN